MRVAMTLEQCWHPVPGGTAVAALELGRELATRPELELVGVSAAHRGPPPPAWRPPIETRPLPLPRIALYEAWHTLRRPRVERATGRCDVIHATGVAMPPRSAPIVLTVHDLAFLTYPEHFSRAGLHFFRRALALARREADVVLCSSEATLAHCVEVGFEPERLRHVPLGVRIEPAAADDVERVRGDYGLERPFVLWTGTIEPRKNLPRLIAGYEQLDADLDLVLVGPQGWNEDLDRRIEKMPAKRRSRIRRLGFVPREDLAPLYAAASVFCFPSLLEGFGFPVLEAMGQGTPVVTSTGTSTEELARGAGVLIDPRDANAIAAGIEAALGDEALTAAGRVRAREYTWGRTADLVIAAYETATRH